MNILRSIKKNVGKAVTWVMETTCDFLSSISRIFANPKYATLLLFLFVSVGMYATGVNAAGDYSAGTEALTTVTEEIAKYVPVVQKLCYAIAGVVAIVGAISVYIAMNNEEQDVKKKIMITVGACIFLIAAAQALPAFFGMGGTAGN